MTQHFRRTAAFSAFQQAPGQRGEHKQLSPGCGSQPQCSVAVMQRRAERAGAGSDSSEYCTTCGTWSKRSQRPGSTALGKRLWAPSRIDLPLCLQGRAPPAASCALKAAAGAKEGQWIQRPLDTWLICSVHPLIYVYRALLASAWKSLAFKLEISPAVLQLLACISVRRICSAVSLPVPNPSQPPRPTPAPWLLNHLFLWQPGCG